jgi:hypothetical protein
MSDQNSIKRELCQQKLEGTQMHRQRVMSLACADGRCIGGGWESTAGQWLLTL